MVDVPLFRPEVTDHRAQRLHGEIVLAQPVSIRTLAFAMLLMTAAVGTWLALGSFARIETAPGFLLTTVPSAKVIAATPGLMTTLSVEEGASVRQGDRLALVTVDRRLDVGVGVASAGLASVEGQMGLSEARIGIASARLAGERERLRSVVSAAEAESRAVQGQMALQEEVVSSNRDLFNQVERFISTGFVSKFEHERRRQTLLASQQALGNLEQQHSAARARAEQANAELGTLVSVEAAEISDLRASHLALTQQQAQLRGEQAYVLTAPISGRVTALQTAEGRAVAAGASLMTIVPEGSALKAEIYAPSRAIGFVRPGQETRLLFDAFPYQRFGSFIGTVVSVSRIIIDPRESDAPLRLEEPVYRVTVALERQHILAYGEPVPLQPGMTLTANIVLERQSFFDWLLTPLRSVWRRT